MIYVGTHNLNAHSLLLDCRDAISMLAIHILQERMMISSSLWWRRKSVQLCGLHKVHTYFGRQSGWQDPTTTKVGIINGCLHSIYLCRCVTSIWRGRQLPRARVPSAL